ncbi:hypothetical protein E4634_00990 [Mangrovimicrobium sediminis]|uniref:Anti sigma-E protein RseA N-terminal domain-containing protein n=1 Tax=Mangrovimicrobium sediminis TaxID=2562682 RepID=A0A4Z0M8X2_9GAMM|nr:hypothetical protein [Haliea sp. SAOS-164]TGD76153.1 hypothetical protein E4634_00990 [Haliea sp. SAOS-164]
MNDKDFELLSQYLDGELDELSTRRVAQRLGSERELRETFAHMTAVDQSIRQVYSASEQVPAHIAAMLESATAAPPRRTTQWAFAAAASVAAAAGLMLTLQWQQPESAGPTVAEVLEITPSMASGWQPLADGRQIRPVLSFRDVDGAWCREYLVEDHGKGTRGVACRDQGKWETRIAVAAVIPGANDAFRPAGAGDSDAVADYTASRADGIALSASEEAKIIASDWQK